jgi:hypothetical protein
MTFDTSISMLAPGTGKTQTARVSVASRKVHVILQESPRKRTARIPVIRGKPSHSRLDRLGLPVAGTAYEQDHAWCLWSPPANFGTPPFELGQKVRLENSFARPATRLIEGTAHAS